MTTDDQRRKTMSNAATAVRPISTEAVLQSHLRAATVGVDAIMQDYTDHSILITHDATYRGLAEIRRFFEELFKALPEGFFDALKMNRQEIAGEVAYILWERKPQISRATDTFVVRNGKILVQTFTAANASS
jgi:ketosteroid isomerase-like protein